MRNHRIVATALFITMAVLSGCGTKDHADVTNNPAKPVVVKGALVETVVSKAIPDSFEVAGTVRARTSAMVSTRIPGTISMLTVREGDRVRKGQLLLQLDAQENQANASGAVAGVDEAQRGLEEARSRKKLADSTFERFQKLFNEQAVTRQEFDIRQTEKDLAGQGVSRAEARLKQAQEGSKAASTVAGYTKIIAPISGIITGRQADLGATVFPAQHLMTIEDEGSYQLELAIPETMAPMVKPGSTVQVTLDGLTTTFTAKVAEVVPSADTASRTFTAKVNLVQKGLKSGMFGRGSFQLDSTANGLLVAKKALVERGSLTFVWIVDKSNSARMRLVKVGTTVGDKVEILSGMSDGERVVVSGLDKVTEGAKVE